MSDAFAALDGLDVETAWRRLGGNEPLYREILRKFSKAQSDATTRIRTALENNDRDSATRDAHNLKGLAGNIGANTLQEIASNLEAAIKSGRNELNAELNELDTELCKVHESIGRTMSGDGSESRSREPGAARGQASPAVVAEALQELRDRLSAGDADAVSAFARFQGLVAGTPLAANLGSVGRSIGDYDFDSALEMLSAVEPESVSAGAPAASLAQDSG